MWTDNETDEDLLGFSIHSNLLKSIVIDEKLLPVTIGLFGDWGGGKSSILKILQHGLEKEDKVAVVYFNSWVFEGYEDAKCAILSTILQELSSQRDLKNLIGDEARDLIKRVNWMKLAQLGVSAGISYLAANPLPFMMSASTALKDTSAKSGGGAEKEASDIDVFDYVKNAEETTHSVRSFRDDFQKLINKTKLKSLVILVDDLDRCSPERLIDNLEAIKLFLNVKQTAFIVAADRRIVENAIRIRYSKMLSDEKSAQAVESLVTDYLEKLIQIPYSLPKLAPHEVRSYLCMLFLKKYLSGDEFSGVLEEYTGFMEKERYSSFQIGDKLKSIEPPETRQAVAESIRLVDACSDAITDGLKGNPRQIKRFLNAFWMRKQVASVSRINNLKDHILIKLMVLEYISSERFDDIYQWHRVSGDGTAEPLKVLEETEDKNAVPDHLSNWSSPKIYNWLKAEPSLSQEDLRDYFWIARSALSDTLSGVRLMTLAMKTCSEQLLSKVEAERKGGLTLLAKLSDDEQAGVLGELGRHAMQDTSDDTALRSLLDLASNGHLNAANRLARCVERITPRNLSPGFGIPLRGFKASRDSAAADIIQKVRNDLMESPTKIGRTLKSKKEN